MKPLKETTHELVVKTTVSSEVSEECKDFIKSLLEFDPENRLGSKGGEAEVFAHPWLSEACFKMRKESSDINFHYESFHEDDPGLKNVDLSQYSELQSCFLQKKVEAPFIPNLSDDPFDCTQFFDSVKSTVSALDNTRIT